MIAMPKMSETLVAERSPIRCGHCGLVSTRDRQIWEEHDEADHRTGVYIVLCKQCSDRLIEPHPRLYREAFKNEPTPGAMLQCLSCLSRAGLICTAPEMKKNGGPGVSFSGPDGWMRIQKAGPGGRGRRCETIKFWSKEAPCPVRNEDPIREDLAIELARRLASDSPPSETDGHNGH